MSSWATQSDPSRRSTVPEPVVSTVGPAAPVLESTENSAEVKPCLSTDAYTVPSGPTVAPLSNETPLATLTKPTGSAVDGVGGGGGVNSTTWISSASGPSARNCCTCA